MFATPEQQTHHFGGRRTVQVCRRRLPALTMARICQMEILAVVQSRGGSEAAAAQALVATTESVPMNSWLRHRFLCRLQHRRQIPTSWRRSICVASEPDPEQIDNGAIQ